MSQSLSPSLTGCTIVPYYKLPFKGYWRLTECIWLLGRTFACSQISTLPKTELHSWNDTRGSTLFQHGRRKNRPSSYLPSKPLTWDHMETLNLYSRRACYHWNTPYRKMERIKVVENYLTYKFGSVHFLYMIHPQKLQSLQEEVRSSHEVQS
jgi:hypothetical protein